MSVAVTGSPDLPVLCGSDGGYAMAFVTPIGTCDVKAVWKELLPGCTAFFDDGTPIAPEAPVGVITARRDFKVLFKLPIGVAPEQLLTLGQLIFVGCTPCPEPGLSPCMGAGGTVHALVVGGSSVVYEQILCETDTIKARTPAWITISLHNPHPYHVHVGYYIPFSGPPLSPAGSGVASEQSIEAAGVYLLRPGSQEIRPVHFENSGTDRIPPFSSATLQLRIWHDLSGVDLGEWNLAVRLYAVVDYCSSPSDCHRVMTYVKSEDASPPLVVPVTMEG